MAKKTWAHCVRDARLIYINRDRFAYLWGANGEKPRNREEAEKLVNRCWSMNPSHYEEYVINRGHTKDELIDHIIGKSCFDCSSFVCAVTQCEGDIFNFRVVKDYNSTMLRAAFVYPTTLTDGPWGSCLWSNGHVAMDSGNGLAIDFAAEFVDVREYRFVDPDPLYQFKDSGQLPWVDYSEPCYK